MVFIPDVKTHTGHMVGEVKFYSFKSASPELEWTVKGNQILLLFKDIPSQYTKFFCFLFCTECWHIATNRFSPGKRNTRKCRRYPWRTRNAQMFEPVSPKWNIWQKLLASKTKWKVLSSLKSHTQPYVRSNKEIVIFKD